MTVPSLVEQNSYLATGSDATYTYSFRILQSSDLLVQILDTSNNVTTLALTINYTVSGVSQYTGGTITLLAGNLTAGYTILIQRNPAILQNTSLQTQGSYDAKSVETALDLLTMIDQDLQAQADRSIHGPSIDTTNMLLPSSALRASKYILFDTFGNVGVSSQAPSTAGFTTSVINITALKLIPTPLTNTVYVTTGYNTNGDGGAGFYFWNASDVSADNGGTIIQLTAGGVGRFNLIVLDIVNVKQFGAKGDGATNDATRLQVAINTMVNQPLRIPTGTYSIATGLTCLSTRLQGDGDNTSAGTTIIRPTNAVAIALTMNGGALQDVFIDGTGTSGKTGILLGSQLASNYPIERVTVANFTGAGAIGMKVRQVVSLKLCNLYINGNSQNVFVTDEAGDSTPTTLWFEDSAFRASTIDEGVLVQGGYQVSFENCVFEGNKKEGLKIYPTGGNALLGTATNCWFEGNWAGAAVPTAHYQCVIDGTGGAGTAGCYFNGVHFVGNPASTKSITLNRVFFTTLSQVSVPVASGVQILIPDAIGEVTFTDNGGRINYSVAVSNTGGGYVNYTSEAFDVGPLWPVAQSWTPWSPSYSTFGAMGYGTITTDVARYKLIGKTLHLWLTFHGTTSGVASSGIIVSLPTGVPQKTGVYTPCTITNVGVIETGYLQTGGGDGIYFRRAGSANFGIGANTGGSISLTIELA